MTNGRRNSPTRKLLNLTQQKTLRAAARAIAAPLLADIPCPPTDLEILGDRLAVTRREEDIGGTGQLRKMGSSYEIVYSPNQPLARRRFTIAHELAHLILIQELQHTRQPTKEVERLCDLIAVELLMPESQFRAALQNQWTIDALFTLARTFQASLTATSRRCAELTGITIFEADGGRITWAQGPLRNTIALEEDELLNEVLAACAGKTGATQLYLNNGQAVRHWTAEYRPLGKTGRALFLLSRVRSDSETPSPDVGR
jgi:hypothetical protein